MKKLESSLTNMLLVLTGVTVISVALLAYMNELTAGPIAEAGMAQLNQALSSVVAEFDNNPVAESDTIFSEKNGKQVIDYIIYPARKNGQLVGTAVEATQLGFSGDLKVLVGFDAEGNIYDYSLLTHSETPGLGSKAETWFKEGTNRDIRGRNPGKGALSVSKDGGDIDAITASTITSRAFLNAVNAAYAAYSGGEVNTVSGATWQATDASSAASGKTEGETDAASGATPAAEEQNN